MSSKGGGGGGGGGRGGGGEGSRVSIPDNVRETIQSIREITGKQHSDEEIYAVLKEFSMDPNETAQKLLYLDTFYEVKRKLDKKKELTLKELTAENSFLKPGYDRLTDEIRELKVYIKWLHPNRQFPDQDLNKLELYFRISQPAA